MTITKLDSITFAVVTDTFLSDGTFKADYDMRITTRNGARVLRSHEGGGIRCGGLVTIALSAEREAELTALPVGGAITVTPRRVQ